ncbi:MAG: adenine deaminase [Streptosporangiaceae bacterium]
MAASSREAAGRLAQHAAELARRIAVASGDEPADLVLRGGQVLSVFTGELLDADVAVAGEHIAGLGRYAGREEVDAAGLILLPGFIDAHMHIESTKLMVDEFARAVLPSGTTTAVLDPHEIANVFGVEGIRALLASAGQMPLDYFIMVSSCVPAGPFESSAYTLEAADIARLLSEEPRAIGLAEMMDFPGVVGGDPAVLAKLAVAQAAGRHVDGHAPGLSGRDLNAYLAAGIGSDHECTSYEEALEKRRLGMQIMIREGSATRNVEALIPLVLTRGPANCMLCTDDTEPHHLLRDGHMNKVIRRAVECGCPAADAVIMATLNAARWHRLDGYGALGPGYLADIVAVEDMQRFEPVQVWKRGRLAAQDGRALGVPAAVVPDSLRGSMHAPPVSAASFSIPADGRIKVIGVQPGTIVTRSLAREPARAGRLAVADPGRDLAKVAVIERHHGTGRIGLGFVTGFGLRRGALASTHAHDAHNLVVIGADDADMAVAANRLRECGGGQVAVAGGRVLAELPLPIGGLVSDWRAEEVAATAERLEEVAETDLGITLPAPLMAMSFLALSVVPELKITDLGLIDTVEFCKTPLSAA